VTWKLLLHTRIRDFWQAIHGRFLLALIVGVGASIFSLAKLLETQLVYHPIQVWALFFGLIVASSFFMFKEIKKWRAKDATTAVIGFVIGLLICTLSPTTTPDGMWFIFICGAIAICTMILPGISGSFILVILGKYDFIMNAIGEMNLPVLVVFALGCIAGILAFAKFLHWLLGRWERETMLVLLGFVVGSLVKVWPWSDKNACAFAQLLRDSVLQPELLGADASDTAYQTLIASGAALDYQIPSAIICFLTGLVTIVLIEYFNTLSQKKSQ